MEFSAQHISIATILGKLERILVRQFSGALALGIVLGVLVGLRPASAQPLLRRKPDDNSTASGNTRQVDAAGDTVKCVLQMQYSPPTLPVPVVTIRIGDSKPMLFLVDTGSNATMTLARWAAADLHIDSFSNGAKSEAEIDHKKYDAYHFEPAILCLVAAVPGSNNLGINVADIHCARDDLELTATNFRTPRLAGTVGINFWSNFTLQFDFVQKTLSVFVDNPQLINGGTMLPQALAPNPSLPALSLRPWPGFEPIPQVRLSYPRARANIALTTDGAPTVPLPSDLWLVVDTGSDSSDLPQEIRPRDVASEHLHSMVHEHNQRILTEKETLATVTLDGQLTEPNVPVNWFRGPLTPNVGMNFLRRFLVTINTKNEKLYLQHASNYAESIRESGFLGFTLRQDQLGHSYVARIYDDHRAESAGIVIGDEILEIDGYALSKYSHYQIGAIADGLAGSACCLMVRHKGNTTVSAIWMLRLDSHSSQRGNIASIRSIKLVGRYSCQVTYTDNSSVWVPFQGNPDDSPPSDGSAGSYYERTSLGDGTFAWAVQSRR